MSNFARAVKALNDVDVLYGALVSNEDYATVLQGRGLLAPDVQVIRGLEELEALAREDADAIVLASEAGVVRAAGALWEMHRLGNMWGFPAVVIASGAQVRAAREAMEQDND